MLSRSDISTDVQWYEVAEKSISDIPVLHYEDFTNDIVYANFFFDLRPLPQELIPYANLLSQLLGKMNTENYSFGELDNALNIHTGGFYTYLNSYLENDSDDKLIPKLRITAKATVDKTDKLFELLDEILNHTKIDDTERLKELLIRHHSQVESQAKNYGVGVAMNRLTSYFKNAGMFNEMINGLIYYDFVTDLTENFDSRNEEIIANLQKVASLLIKKQNLIAGITCSGENFTTYQEAFNNFVPELAEGEVSLNQWKFNLEPKNEGLMSSSLVQYVTKGYDYKKLGYEWDGKMEVLNQILSTDYLQTQIRVMGGAYGGWAQVSPTGTLMFASYRDPNLTETLDNYDAGAEYLQNFDADSTEMTRYIIGTISNIDYPSTASQRGTIAMSNYFKKETKEKMQKERNAILNTTAEDISGYAQLISDVMSQDIYCVYGNDQKINAHEELFESVRQVVQ
jgi:Zn-dependent M16 (insulinase) family peptidase